MSQWNEINEKNIDDKAITFYNWTETIRQIKL